jgi:hypothetical protein
MRHNRLQHLDSEVVLAHQLKLQGFPSPFPVNASTREVSFDESIA